MKKRGAQRAVRIAKWSGAALVALIIVLTIVSTRVRFTALWGRFNLHLWPGAFQVLVWQPGTQDTNLDLSYVVTDYMSPPSWKFIIDQRSRGSQYSGFYGPFWFWLLLAGIPTVLLWWIDRPKARAGHCTACGYDLSTLPPRAPCPECGMAPEQMQPGSAIPP